MSFSPDVLALNADVLRTKESVNIDASKGGYRSALEKKAADTWVGMAFEWFMYEPFKLNFPGGSYTPDFFGMFRYFNGSVLGVAEIKGWNKNLRADRLKYRVAAEHHPWLKFVWVTWKKNDGWTEEWYGKS